MKQLIGAQIPVFNRLIKDSAPLTNMNDKIYILDKTKQWVLDNISPIFELQQDERTNCLSYECVGCGRELIPEQSDMILVVPPSILCMRTLRFCLPCHGAIESWFKRGNFIRAEAVRGTGK